jgi:hypothetical protein
MDVLILYYSSNSHLKFAQNYLHTDLLHEELNSEP